MHNYICSELYYPAPWGVLYLINDEKRYGIALQEKIIDLLTGNLLDIKKDILIPNAVKNLDSDDCIIEMSWEALLQALNQD